MSIAIYPGSFDPVTNGHIDVIRRAANIFDEVIVCVLVNPAKAPVFTPEERVEFITKVTHDIPNVRAEMFTGLLADYAKQKNCNVLIKGLRAVSDFEYEFQQSLTNKVLNPQLETVFLNTSAEHMYLSSSIVKQVALFGGDIEPFVPAEIVEQVSARLKEAAYF